MVSLVLAAVMVSTNVPLAAMTESHRALVQPVIEHASLQREYLVRTFRGRLPQFEFLLDDMVACSVLSQKLGLTTYRIVEEIPGRAVGDDHEGARGTLQEVYCAEGLRIYYVEGRQQGLLQASGQGVVIVQFAQVGPDTIEYSGRMLVHIDNPIVSTLAQMFFVFVRGTVDWHFDHVMSQPISLSGFALDDPAMLRRCIAQMPAEDYWLLAPFADRL
jgi:hypothetical protein